MDINALLPLLLGKGDMTDKTKLFSMLAGGKNPEDMVGKDMSGLFKLLADKKKTRPQEATGLGSITAFAPADIIGTLLKMLDAV